MKTLFILTPVFMLAPKRIWMNTQVQK